MSSENEFMFKEDIPSIFIGKDGSEVNINIKDEIKKILEKEYKVDEDSLRNFLFIRVGSFNRDDIKLKEDQDFYDLDKKGLEQLENNIGNFEVNNTNIYKNKVNEILSSYSDSTEFNGYQYTDYLINAFKIISKTQLILIVCYCFLKTPGNRAQNKVTTIKKYLFYNMVLLIEDFSCNYYNNTKTGILKFLQTIYTIATSTSTYNENYMSTYILLGIIFCRRYLTNAGSRYNTVLIELLILMYGCFNIINTKYVTDKYGNILCSIPYVKYFFKKSEQHKIPELKKFITKHMRTMYNIDEILTKEFQESLKEFTVTCPAKQLKISTESLEYIDYLNTFYDINNLGIENIHDKLIWYIAEYGIKEITKVDLSERIEDIDVCTYPYYNMISNVYHLYNNNTTFNQKQLRFIEDFFNMFVAKIKPCMLRNSKKYKKFFITDDDKYEQLVTFGTKSLTDLESAYKNKKTDIIIEELKHMLHFMKMNYYFSSIILRHFFMTLCDFEKELDYKYKCVLDWEYFNRMTSVEYIFNNNAGVFDSIFSEIEKISDSVTVNNIEKYDIVYPNNAELYLQMHKLVSIYVLWNRRKSEYEEVKKEFNDDLKTICLKRIFLSVLYHKYYILNKIANGINYKYFDDTSSIKFKNPYAILNIHVIDKYKFEAIDDLTIEIKNAIKNSTINEKICENYLSLFRNNDIKKTCIISYSQEFLNYIILNLIDMFMYDAEYNMFDNMLYTTPNNKLFGIINCSSDSFLYGKHGVPGVLAKLATQYYLSDIYEIVRVLSFVFINSRRFISDPKAIVKSDVRTLGNCAFMTSYVFALSLLKDDKEIMKYFKFENYMSKTLLFTILKRLRILIREYELNADAKYNKKAINLTMQYIALLGIRYVKDYNNVKFDQSRDLCPIKAANERLLNSFINSIDKCCDYITENKSICKQYKNTNDDKYKEIFEKCKKIYDKVYNIIIAWDNKHNSNNYVRDNFTLSISNFKKDVLNELNIKLFKLTDERLMYSSYKELKNRYYIGLCEQYDKIKDLYNSFGISNKLFDIFYYLSCIVKIHDYIKEHLFCYMVIDKSSRELTFAPFYEEEWDFPGHLAIIYDFDYGIKNTIYGYGVTEEKITINGENKKFVNATLYDEILRLISIFQSDNIKHGKWFFTELYVDIIKNIANKFVSEKYHSMMCLDEIYTYEIAENVLNECFDNSYKEYMFKNPNLVEKPKHYKEQDDKYRHPVFHFDIFMRCLWPHCLPYKLRPFDTLKADYLQHIMPNDNIFNIDLQQYMNNKVKGGKNSKILKILVLVIMITVIILIIVILVIVIAKYVQKQRRQQIK